MPFVLVHHNSGIENATLEQTRDILYEGIARECSFEGGPMTPHDVRIFMHAKGQLDRTPWDIDISMMANDVPERRNLDERLQPVAKQLGALLIPKGISFGLWSTLHGPNSFTSSRDFA